MLVNLKFIHGKRLYLIWLMLCVILLYLTYLVLPSNILFQIPKKRVDFIITGLDQQDKEHVVIVGFKQWGRSFQGGNR